MRNLTGYATKPCNPATLFNEKGTLYAENLARSNLDYYSKRILFLPYFIAKLTLN